MLVISVDNIIDFKHNLRILSLSGFTYDPQDNIYVASIPELQGCMVHGETSCQLDLVIAGSCIRVRPVLK